MVLMIRDRVVHVPDKPPKEVVTDINVLTVGRRHGAILQAYFGPFLFLLDCGIPNIAVLKNKIPEISYNDKNRLVKTCGRRCVPHVLRGRIWCALMRLNPCRIEKAYLFLIPLSLSPKTWYQFSRGYSQTTARTSEQDGYTRNRSPPICLVNIVRTHVCIATTQLHDSDPSEHENTEGTHIFDAHRDVQRFIPMQ